MDFTVEAKKLAQKYKSGSVATITKPTISKPLESAYTKAAQVFLGTSTTPILNIKTITIPGIGQFQTDISTGKPATSTRSTLSTSEKNQIRGGSFSDTKKEIDHLIPVSLGGTSVSENLQALRNKKTISQKVYDFFTGKNRLPSDYKPENRQEGKMLVELNAINDYKAGKITLNQARMKVIEYQLRPKKTQDFLWEEAKKNLTGISLAKGLLKGAKEFFTEAIPEAFQYTARTITSIASPLKGFQPKGKVSQALLGTTEKIKGAGEETINTQNWITQKLGGGDIAKGIGLAVAPLFMGTTKGLDVVLSPLSAVKKGASAIAKSNNLDEIIKIIKPILKGKTDDEIRAIATPLVKITKPQEVAEYLSKEVIKPLSETTQSISQAKGEMGQDTIKPVINIEKLNISQKAKQKIIKTAEEIKPELEKIKGGVLSNDEVIEAAQKSEILKRGTTKKTTLKSEAALLKTRQHLAELAKQEKLTPEFIDTLKIVKEEATRRGRELQALGIEADPSLGTIKTKLVKQLLDMGIETDKIIKAAEGIDFTNAKQVMKFYRTFVKPTLPEIIDEYRYINMLSSPKTQIVNTFSNILQATFLRPATRLSSGIIDNIAHTLTGKEQEFYIKQIPAYYKGAFNSFGDALNESMKVMRGEQMIYRPDIKSIPTGLKVLKPFQIIPKLMEASDVFFRKIISGGEIEALMSKGMTESEAITKSVKTAEEMVFRKALDPENKTGQGLILQTIDKLTTAVYKFRNVPGVKWFIPFVQTPMNILKQGIEYSPLGIITLAKNTHKIEQFGKTLVGTTVFAGAGWLALKDKTIWAVPTNQKEKDAFYAAGMQPYSIKIGDKWVSYSRLGPLAYPIAMAAAIKFYTKDNPKAVGDNEFQKITKIISGIAQFFSDQSYVQGIGDFVNIAQGDITALTRAASQIPSQLIPLTALQRWIANIIDPIYRKTDKKLSVEGIIENLKSGIPFLTKGLPAYTTPTGEEEKRQYPFFNPLSPITISKESPEWKNYFNTLQKVSSERTLETKSKDELKQSAQELYDKMKILPKEEAKRQFDNLIKTNPSLAKEISDLVKEIKLDYKENFLKTLGVENGQRAKYIVEEINKLRTQEEKRIYFQNLIDKKVITKQVNEQILPLLNNK